MLDRLRRHTQHLGSAPADPDQHQAFVELLIAAMYADHRVTQTELDALERFDESHPDWDDGAFSIAQYFGPAAAAVRVALSQGSMKAFVDDVALRLHDAQLRDDVVGACREILSGDGVTSEEQEFLDLLAGLPTSS